MYHPLRFNYRHSIFILLPMNDNYKWAQIMRIWVTRLRSNIKFTFLRMKEEGMWSKDIGIRSERRLELSMNIPTMDLSATHVPEHIPTLNILLTSGFFYFQKLYKNISSHFRKKGMY